MAERHLPGAPRDYRSGTHQGFDFFNGRSGKPLASDEPVMAVAEGEIVRIDRAYEEPAKERLSYYAELSASSGFVGEYGLDQVRGRQVWIPTRPSTDRAMPTSRKSIRSCSRAMRSGRARPSV